MFWRLLVPIILLIWLQIILELETLSKSVRSEFDDSYKKLLCARRDVYQQNIEDAIMFLRDMEPSFTAQVEDYLPLENEECDGSGYSIYRETNEELELLYPNWIFQETVPGVDDG